MFCFVLRYALTRAQVLLQLTRKKARSVICVPFYHGVQATSTEPEMKKVVTRTGWFGVSTRR